MRHAILMTVILVIGCKTVFLQTDDFREKLDRGCSTEDRCQQLVTEARQRKAKCKPNTIGFIPCGEATKDLNEAKKLLGAVKAEERNKLMAEKEALAIEAREELDRKREEYKAQKEAERAAAEAKWQEQRDLEAAAEQVKVEAQQELERKARTKEYAVPVISAIICDLKEQVKSLQEALRYQNKIDQKSGTIDPGARRGIVEDMELTKERIRDWKAALRRGHAAKPQKCSKTYAQIRACRYQSSGCEEPIGTYADIWRSAKDELFNGPDDEDPAELPHKPETEEEPDEETAGDGPANPYGN